MKKALLSLTFTFPWSKSKWAPMGHYISVRQTTAHCPGAHWSSNPGLEGDPPGHNQSTHQEMSRHAHRWGSYTLVSHIMSCSDLCFYNPVNLWFKHFPSFRLNDCVILFWADFTVDISFRLSTWIISSDIGLLPRWFSKNLSWWVGANTSCDVQN